MYKIKLSPYAKTFYYEWVLNSDSYRYNITIDQTLYGPLNVERLRNALRRYVSEHLVLNSHIGEVEDEPHWVRNDKVDELGYSGELLDDTQLFQYVIRPFALNNGPLYRFLLVRLTDEAHRFILVFHHTVVDGSAALDPGVFEAISRYYNDPRHAEKCSIDNQIQQITTLTQTLEAQLEENKVQRQVFWHQQLADVDSVDLRFLKLEENTAQPQEGANPNSIQTLSFSFSPVEQDKLDQLKAQYGITPYLYGQCLLALLLYRHTGQGRFAIAYPISIREGLDFNYGSQINTNLAIYQLDSNTTVLDLLNQGHDQFNATLRGENKPAYYPISCILQEASNTDLLRIGFTKTYFRERAFEFEGMTQTECHSKLSPDEVAQETLLFEQDARNPLHYRARYDKNGINTELLSTFVRTYKRLFLEVLDDLLSGIADKRITAYSLLDAAQYQQIVYDFNQTDKDYPRDKTIHALFEEQVLKTPHHTAVVYEDHSLTYDELNQKANQLAHHLIEHYRIQPDDLVALCLERSELMIVAMLGVLKAGGAYVPIEPKYPEERTAYILNQTETSVILTNQIHEDKLRQLVGKQCNHIDVLVLDNPQTQTKLVKQADTNPVTSTTSTHLIYVMYTSGTTGYPKGVMIEHRSVTNYTMYLISDNQLNDQSRGSQYAGFSFDAMVCEVFPILLSGGALVIVSNENKLEIAITNKIFSKNKITYAFLPSMLSESFFKLENDNIKNIIVAGDKLHHFYQTGYRIVNGYGPTEATVHTTSFVVDRQYKNIPIGKPISNVRCYVVSSGFNLLPIGVIGELLIGGDSLARGYLSDVYLTEKIFVSNPFQTREEKSEDRNYFLYKTGDLVRLLPDGNLEFIGRKDTQVKIRGHRIELSEIEHYLSQYPHIQQAVVIAKSVRLETSTPASSILLAYYISEIHLDEQEIRHYLAVHLPEYMIPQVLIPLSSFPLTLNGKLDIDALPFKVDKLIKEYHPPRTKFEEQITRIYAKLLGLPADKLSITADLFRIGGDSIVVIQICSQLKNKLDITVTPKTILTYRTIEKLSNYLTTSQQNLPEKPKLLVESGLLLGVCPLLPIQKWFFNQPFPQPHHFNQSFLIKTPPINLDLLASSLVQLVRHHDAFRIRYKKMKAGRYVQYYGTDVPTVQLQLCDILSWGMQEGTPEFQAKLQDQLTDWQNHFDIEQGPLSCFGYVTGYADGSSRIYVAMHHLTVDAVSWRIILTDLERIYTHLMQGADTTVLTRCLENKGTSYRQWIQIVKSYPSQHPQEKKDWDQCRAGFTTFNNALKSWIEPHTESTKEVIYLDEEKTMQWMAATSSVSTHAALLTPFAYALKILLMNSPWQFKHFYLTLEGHGREPIDERIDLSHTVGWFTTMYPLELEFPVHLAKGLHDIQNRLEQVPHHGIGYGAFFGYDQLPCILFNYLGQFQSEAGLDASWVFANEDSGLAIAGANLDSNILTINTWISEKRLVLHLQSKLNPERLRTLVVTWKEAMNTLLEGKPMRTKATRRAYEKHNTLSSRTLKKPEHSYDSTKKSMLEQQLLGILDTHQSRSATLRQCSPAEMMYFEKCLSVDLSRKNINRVLLTGATGYLGCNLLYQLLHRTDYQVFALIRADDEESAFLRLRQKFYLYFNESLDQWENSRLSVIKANIEQKDLGLSREQYHLLVTQIDSVVHAASLVKLYGEEDLFYAANVKATQNLIEFCQFTHQKDFHYISTQSVLKKQAEAHTCLVYSEEDHPDDLVFSENNIYLQTKLQAEQQVVQSQQYGINTTIYRVGNLAFMYQNGSVQENINHVAFAHWLRYIFQLGGVFQEISQVGISPVDLTAEAIILLFDRKYSSNVIYHVFNPYPFNLVGLTYKEGQPIKKVSIETFMEWIISALQKGGDIESLFLFLFAQGWLDIDGLYQFSSRVYLQDKTEWILNKLGFQWKSISPELFDKYISRLLNQHLSPISANQK